MYLEAKETARLYKLLTEKLGNDTTEAMFKYIDNKTERSVEASIKTLATKDDIVSLRKDFNSDLTILRKDFGEDMTKLRKDMNDNIKWMFVFWVGQVGATLATMILILKK